MPRPAKTTSRRIADAAYELFYREGFAHVGVDAIAEAAGITKRTLYYHFESKDALVAAVLDLQHELMLKRIERWTERASGNPAHMVRPCAPSSHLVQTAGMRGSGFTRAAMEFARSPGHPARVAARRHKLAVESWFAEQFARNGVRAPQRLARQVVLLLEGCNCLILVHGDPGYADAASQAAQLLAEEHQSDLSRAHAATMRNTPHGMPARRTRRRSS